MILLINPKATNWRWRIPLSVLSIGASLGGRYSYQILDGNIDNRLFENTLQLIEDKDIKYVGLTVMPGPQLAQAIRLAKLIRQTHPYMKIIWGGYFPTLHANTVLKSGYVDYVVRDQGDYAFKQLIDVLEYGGSIDTINGLSYVNGGIHHTQKQELIDPNELPSLPFTKIPVSNYIGKTWLGTRTINYHSSVGCPFLCGFCAVAAIYKARWFGLAPGRIVDDLSWFKKEYNINAVEFHDNNFFTSEKRTLEFAERMRGQGISWWGEARPDTMLAYDDRTWQAMKEAGLKMVFFGAESSSQRVLDVMHKGGTQTPDTVLELANKMQSYNIVPEFSFVLGSPTNTITDDIEQDIQFIRKVKQINPASEIVIYVYSPVMFEEAELFQMAEDHGFAYPASLEDWLLPQWERHDLRKNPVTPWLSSNNLKRIKNFERILNARYPTNSDLKLSTIQRRILQVLGAWRYKLSVYVAPYEVALMQRFFRYRQPEIEGF